MLEMCENRSPGTFKNRCFSWKGVQISLVAGVSKKYQKGVQTASRNDATIDKIGYWECCGKSWENAFQESLQKMRKWDPESE